jgi:hypothetical protein
MRGSISSDMIGTSAAGGVELPAFFFCFEPDLNLVLMVTGSALKACENSAVGFFTQFALLLHSGKLR